MLESISILSFLFFLVSILYFYRRGLELESSYLSFFVFFFYLYSGYGIFKTEEYALELWVDYFCFLFVFIVFFFIFSKLFFRFGEGRTLRIKRFFERAILSKYSGVIIFSYFCVEFISLAYPENRLPLIFNPPSPDILSAFDMRYKEVTILSKVLSYFSMLLAPLFYISVCYRFKSIFLVFCVIFVLAYISYIVDGYISRGQIASYYFLFAVYVFYYRPDFRKHLIIFSVFLAIAFLVFSYFYAAIRLGAENNEGSLISAVLSILDKEGSLISETGVDLLRSGEFASFFGYHSWLTTFYIPKVFLPGFESYNLNDHISEVVLGLDSGVRGFYVVLPGLLVEAIFIYGRAMFFLHAIVLSFFVSLVFMMVRILPFNHLVFANIFWLGSYSLNRSGITSFVAQSFNQMLLVLAVVFLVFVVRRVR